MMKKMNKTKLVIFLSLTAVILIAGVYLIRFARRTVTSEKLLTRAENQEEIELFYYRTVPGLKRAEELGLVVPVYKTYEIPDTDAKLVIDRIWYSQRQIYIFYHVENLDTPAYLGGEVELPGRSFSEKFVFWGTDSIGRATEKGIIYGGSFFSCLRLPPLMDESGNLPSEVESINYKPCLLIYPEAKTKEARSLTFDPFNIKLNYSKEKEKVEKFAIEGSVKIDEDILKFYQINITPSYNRIYFQYLNKKKDMVCGISGTVETDKGEIRTLDSPPAVISEYPYHYYVDFPPFHHPPKVLKLKISSLDLAGCDNFSFEIDTSRYKNKKGSHKIGENIGRIKNSDILLDQIKIDREDVWVEISYKTQSELDKPRKMLTAGFYVFEDRIEYIKKIYGAKRHPSNILKIRNERYEKPSPDDLFGLKWNGGNRFAFCISRSFWDTSEKIYVTVENLSYRIESNASVDIFLKR